MFIEPIEVATAALAPVPRSRSTRLKLAVGLVFLAVCVMLVLPWTLLVALWFGLAACFRGIATALRHTRAMVTYSGETVLGR